MLAATAFPFGVKVVASRRGRTPNLDGKRWYRAAQRYAHSRVALMICNSEELASHTMASDPAPPPLAVVYNGVDIDRLQPEALPREPTIAMVANFIGYKRHDRFLKAFQLVRNTIPSAKAVLVGEGPERASIEALISTLQLGSSVQLVGSVADPAPYMLGARVIALTSDHEGFPNVLLEGMALARPVVATSVGGVPELVTDGIEGRTCGLEPEEVGKALASVLSTPDLAEEMGAAARRRAEAFGWPRVIEQTERLYRRVVADDPLPRGALVT
jgi:glycosyltransferase involved in cell wall biosynthesis